MAVGSGRLKNLCMTRCSVQMPNVREKFVLLAGFVRDCFMKCERERIYQDCSLKVDSIVP